MPDVMKICTLVPAFKGGMHRQNGLFVSIFFFLRKASRKKNAFAIEIIRSLEKDLAILPRTMSLLGLLSGALFYANESY
jgi:hypothetical protein